MFLLLLLEIKKEIYNDSIDSVDTADNIKTSEKNIDINTNEKLDNNDYIKDERKSIDETKGEKPR